MTHEEYEDIAALDALGAATPDEALSLAAHADACDDCRRAREQYAEAATLLAQGLDPVSPPPEIRERIVGAVSEEPHALLHAESRFHVRPWWLATAATLFLALWGWREAGIRVAREHIATQQAEIRSLSEEKDRHTLPLLLTTQLTDREIVWGKAAARVLFVLAAVAAGAPVLVLTLFFGGVDQSAA